MSTPTAHGVTASPNGTASAGLRSTGQTTHQTSQRGRWFATLLGLLLLPLVSLPATTALAGEAQVIDARASALGDNRYRIDATVEHGDTGWDHYANAFVVYSLEGERLGTRELAHPHVNEQPFTRSLTLELPPGTTQVEISAVDSVHGEGEQRFLLDIPAP